MTLTTLEKNKTLVTEQIASTQAKLNNAKTEEERARYQSELSQQNALLKQFNAYIEQASKNSDKQIKVVLPVSATKVEGIQLKFNK
jgi:hypothetical protein